MSQSMLASFGISCSSRCQGTVAGQVIIHLDLNLARAQKALLAIERRDTRHLRVQRAENQADIREMVEAGFLTVSGNASESATVLGAVTADGRKFLQLFPSRYRFCDAR